MAQSLESESTTPPDSLLHILRDSGAPEGSTDYTTLVLIHGFAWHSGIFAKLLPLAAQHNARIVLVNRRDYLGSAPYTPAELSTLNEAAASSDASTANTALLGFMSDRARELHDLLARYVSATAIPPARREANGGGGGVVLACWSFGTCLATALLANVASFPATRHGVSLSRYVRRVIFHDPPYLALGFPPMPNAYNPLSDPTIAPEEATDAFSAWVSGYYAHADPESESGSPDTLEPRTPLASPPPTLSTLTAEERASAFFPGPGQPGGSESLLLVSGIRSGLFAALRERALCLPEPLAGNDQGKEGAGRSSMGMGTDSDWDADAGAWPEVEVRYVWCDRSVWEMPWGVWKMRAQVEEDRRAGKSLRDFGFLRLKGANHFVHWDEPERALKAFLSAKSTDSA